MMKDFIERRFEDLKLKFLPEKNISFEEKAELVSIWEKMQSSALLQKSSDIYNELDKLSKKQLPPQPAIADPQTPLESYINTFTFIENKNKA